MRGFLFVSILQRGNSFVGVDSALAPCVLPIGHYRSHNCPHYQFARACEAVSVLALGLHEPRIAHTHPRSATLGGQRSRARRSKRSPDGLHCGTAGSYSPRLYIPMLCTAFRHGRLISGNRMIGYCHISKWPWPRVIQLRNHSGKARRADSTYSCQGHSTQ